MQACMDAIEQLQYPGVCVMGQPAYDAYEEGSSGEHIWLRYATRFLVGAREYTLEMGVPMPIGASEEEREQLLREADAGMNQLAGFVENKVALMLQRVPPNQGPLPTPRPTERPSTPPPSSSPAAQRVPRPASMPAAQTAAQPVQSAQSSPQTNIRDGREHRDQRNERDGREMREMPAPYNSSASNAPVQSQRDVTVPPTHPPLGVTMPLAMTGDTGGNLTLPQFITTIRDTMNLNPKQAMEMLHVKSLNNLNLRDALDKLRTIVEGEGAKETPTGVINAAPTTSKPVPTPTSNNQKSRETAATTNADAKSPTSKPTQGGQAAQKTPTSPAAPARTGGNPALNIPGLTLGTSALKSAPKEQRPTYTFDEEEDEDNLDELLEELDEDDEETAELTKQERAHAEALINQFRESRGPTVANASRLQVLHNVVIGQINEDELQDLIQGIWDVNSVKKLKVDQAELLISWAKTDEFYDEVKAVLTVLEEM